MGKQATEEKKYLDGDKNFPIFYEDKEIRIFKNSEENKIFVEHVKSGVFMRIWASSTFGGELMFVTRNRMEPFIGNHEIAWRVYKD